MKKNNIVKYHNDLNSITFHNFGSIDFDLFMSICSQMVEKENSEVEISFSELRSMAEFNKHWSEDQFVKCLESMNLKQLLSHGRIEDDRYIKIFVLFPELWIDKEKKVLIVKANKDYLYILNDLKKSFTRFELKEFVSLDSKYAKTLYRLLKQFRTTGAYITSINDFKSILSIPKSYSNKYITDKIIKPSVSSLSKYFNNLSCEVQYEAKRGRPVKGYKFTFEPEKVPKQIQEQEKPKKEKSKNSFHNFEQRTYDYNELEKMISKRW